MKWNWGTKIILVYCGFVVFMLGMVYMAVSQKFDLVTPDYYNQELKYQEVIEGKTNSNLMKEQVKIIVENGVVNVVFPSALGSLDSGVVLFYRPDNAAFDWSSKLGTSLNYQFDGKKLAYGNYKVKLTYIAQGKKYFDEQSLFIPQNQAAIK